MFLCGSNSEGGQFEKSETKKSIRKNEWISITLSLFKVYNLTDHPMS